MWDSAKDGTMFAWNYDSLNRGWGGDKKPFGEFDGCVGGWDIEGEPYTVGNGRAGAGSAAACSAAAPTTGAASRCASAPTTSAARRIDGLGDDWPITYDDIKPYYDKLDQFVGIFGTNHAKRDRAAQRAGRHLPAAAQAARATSC